MTRDAIVQLVRNGLDDQLLIASTVDEGIVPPLLAAAILRPLLATVGERAA